MPSAEIGLGCPGCHGDTIEHTTMAQLAPGPDITNEAVCMRFGFRGKVAIFELTAAVAQLLTVLGAATPTLWVEHLDRPGAARWEQRAGAAFVAGFNFLKPFNRDGRVFCDCPPGSSEHREGCVFRL